QVFNRADYDTPGQKDKPEEEWVVVENAWPAIVTQELVDEVNSMVRKSHSGNAPGSTKKTDAEPFALSGKVVCGICGRALNGVTSGRKGAYRYYRCTKARDSGSAACGLPQIAQKRVEDAVMKVFSEQVMTDGLLEGMIEVAREGRNARNSDEGRRTRDIGKGIADLERRRRNLTLAVEEGSVNLSDVKGRMDELSQQIRTLNEDLKKAKAQLNPLPAADKWNLKNFRKQLMAFIEMDRHKALRSIVDSFVERVTVYPARVDVSIALACPECKSDVQDAPQKSRPKAQKKRSTESETELSDCKFNSGAEDET
ncbi:MAG: recombinase family protein, partial [Synergistaceae bacterium]|nr:recombinase family protein [Synergistaceae bacterium]